ncbi:MAG: primosomal protein N' [Candidatus Puniceispirillaceae bacterium]
MPADFYSDDHAPAARLVQVAVPVPQKRGVLLVYDYLPGPAIHAPVGTIVKIPLGTRHVWGIIMGVSATSKVDISKLKAVTMLADVPPLSQPNLQFLEQVCRWTLAPFGSVMRLMLNTPDALVPPPEQPVFTLPETPLSDVVRLTPQRARILAFLETAPALGASEIARETGVSTGVISAMEKTGLLAKYMAARSPMAEGFSADQLQRARKNFSLSADQQAIADALASYPAEEFSAHLLDGVTGSGKTEVYFDRVADMAAAGKQVLILLPEIALTSAWQDRFEKRFGFKPGLWHSSVTNARRRHVWRQAASGQPMIVAGARSALFLPFANLGLIIVDEEHDASYKQEDQTAYQARDMALLRAKITQIPIILASATPSMESWVNAGAARQANSGHKDWHQHLLTSRFGAASLPEIQLVDMRLSRPPRGHWLSAELQEALKQTLSAGEQSLLFLNRRGYAPVTLCSSCGHRLACHQCDSLLVTHRLAGRVQCHFCGISQPLSRQCPACEEPDSLRAVGPGVERLEEEIRMLFPDAGIAILSSDTVRSAAEAEAFFKGVESGEIDIIIGTQMAAKGHDFPRLTLVGVIDADLGIAGGDLRAAERTYQLLWQVAGRSGRAEHKGRALVQTFQPSHPVLSALSHIQPDNPVAARDSFMQAEADAREAAAMPPFGRLAALILSGRDLALVEQAAQKLALACPNYQGVDIYGPAPAPLSRIRGAHRIRFLIRAQKNVAIQKIILEWLDRVAVPGQVRVVCDIDPYSFL